MNCRCSITPVLLLALLFLAANLSAQTPSITSFSPPAGTVGTQVYIYGSGFISSTVVRFNGVIASSQLISQQPTGQINAYVPAGATTGLISVSNAVNQITYSSASFIVATPCITNFSPNAGGSNAVIRLSGYNFTGATNVQIGGVNVPFQRPTTDNDLFATNSSSAVSGLISVTVSNRTGYSAGNFYCPPSITSFSPASGQVGTSVTITGKNLLNAGVIFSNSIVVGASSSVSNQLVAIVPSGAVSGALGVSNPAGTSYSSSRFLIPPSLSSFSPAFGSPGTDVTINGLNLNAGGTPTVQFGNATASVRSASGTQVIATVPGGGASGPISLTTSDGTAFSASNFYLPPGISGFSPQWGSPGKIVTVTGSNFLGATSVAFNGLNAGVPTVSNNTCLSIAIPANGSSGLLSVSAPAGTASSVAYFYYPPVISDFSPSTGLPGTWVTINGGSFWGVTNVQFGTGNTTSFFVTNNNVMGVALPTNATTGKIQVISPAGAASSAADFTLDKLVIARLPSNVVSIAWTTNSLGYALQSATNLPSTNWITTTNIPIVLNGRNTVTNRIGATNTFFRLKK